MNIQMLPPLQEKLKALPEKKILDVGCGQNKRPGTIGMDIREDSDADIIHDFNRFPYPIADNTFDEVLSVSSLTYATDLFRTMLELHRITKPGGRVCVFGPSFNSTAYQEDPYIKNRLSHNTFTALCGPMQRTWGTYENREHTYYIPRCVEYRMSWDNRPKSLFDRFVLWIANKKPDFYAARLAFILPVQRVYYELEVAK